MIRVTLFDADGRLGARLTVLDAAEADLNGQWVEGHHSPAEAFVEAGTVQPRPVTGLPETHTLDADTDWPVPDVPEGTEVEIDGEAMGTVDGGGLVLSFPEPGQYRVALRPPFPWQPAECEVTVE